MAYRWKANRDSGSVRSHRNPDTKRRYPRSETGMMFKAHNGRAAMSAAMHAAMPLLVTGQYDVSVAPVRRGWDAGDPLSVGVLIVEADPTEEPWEYPETPEYVWDYLFGLTNGLDMNDWVI